jgi:exosortase A
MQAGPVLGRSTFTLRPATGLQAFIAITLAMAIVLAAFAPTVWSMVEIWRRSDTFVHGFLVLPAFLYFVWIRRHQLAALPIKPFWPGLAGVFGAGFLWLLGELAGALSPAQFGAVGLVPAVLLTLFGWQWFRALLFPCAFLFLAVPFGEVFVPTLIQWTADFTVAALRLSGVPVYREGTHFVVPSGHWSVVDACSGIRYLIASAVTGALFASLMYRSPVRRAVFMLAAVLVPILANWIRAYGIVMLGHLSGNRLAAGVDHLVYGWVFFGIVIFVLFAIGARWREGGEPPPEPAPSSRTVPGGGLSVWALAAAALLVVCWPLARAAMMAPLGGELPAPPAPQATAGWSVAPAFTQWRAITQRPTLERVTCFEKNGQLVAVQLSVYRDQVEGAELVTSANQLVDLLSKVGWRITAQSLGSWPEAGGPYRETLLQADRKLAVRDWYWLGNGTTTSDVRAKIDLALDRLGRRDDTSAWVIVFTPVGDDVAAARTTLDTFAREMGGSVVSVLQELRR